MLLELPGRGESSGFLSITETGPGKFPADCGYDDISIINNTTQLASFILFKSAGRDEEFCQ